MKKTPFLFAVSGVKNSGKTSLIADLIPILTGRGLKVATIKHDGHEFVPDVPGTDTYVHMQAGAYGTAIFSGEQYMVIKKETGVTEERLREQFPEADLILLEGFKHSKYPKIEIVREGNSKENICSPENLVAVISDFEPICHKAVPIIDLADKERIAETILARCYAETEVSMVVLAGGMSRRMGCDKADLCWNGKSFLEIQVEKGRQLGIHEILISGYRGVRCGLPVIPDRYERRGPLGGLETVLRKAKHQKCLVLSVDVPLVTVEILYGLLAKAMESKSKAVILQHGKKQEPLIGVYDAALADEMEKELQNGKGSMFALLKRVGYEVYISSAPEEIFCNINDAEAYQMLGKTC